MRNLSYSLFLLFQPLSIIYAQENKQNQVYATVEVYNSHYHRMPSKFVNQTFAVYVALPGSYFIKDTTYPVIYMTDANVHFGMMTDIARSLQGGKEMPEAILVGITYPNEQRKWSGKLRLRDYTPAATAQMDKMIGVDSIKSGGGDAFLRFVKDELIPFVETKYRIKPNQRTFTGYSIAGLLALHWVFTEPQLFQQYIIGSPSIWYDGKRIFEEEKKFAVGRENLDLKVFMSVGSKENIMVQDMVDMASILKSRNYRGLQLRHVVLEDETHASAVSGCFQQGLRFLFKPQK